MPVTQQQPIFTPGEAERFAMLWAGFDVCNSNDAEAKSKGNALRRMMAGKTLDDETPLRLVDALELPEIRAAFDDQMQPARQSLSLADVAALEEKCRELEGQVSKALEHNLTLTDALARLQGRSQQNGSFTGPLLSGVLALALAVECVLAVVGLFGGRGTPRAAAPTPALPSVALASVPKETPEPSSAVVIKTPSYMVTASGRVFMLARKAKPKPVPVVVVPESKF